MTVQESAVSMFTIVWILASTALVQPAPQAAPTALGQAYFLFVEGLVLEDKGDVDGAVRLYREALELVPDAAEVYAELAALYARQGLATESVSEARKAIAIEPANREANRILGFVLGTIADQRRDASMREEAIGHFETALSGGVRDPGAQLMVSRLAMESRRYKLAITWLTRFLLDQTGYREAMELLAEAYEADGQPARAAELVAELVEGADDPLRVRTWLAELHEDAGAWRQAAAVWQTLEASVPDSVLYSMRRAMALANAGEPEAAGRVLEELTARAPDNVRAWYLRSQVERRAGLSLKFIFVGAILFRLLLLITVPTLSDDVYRYMWDGYVANYGVSPYAYPLDSPVLDYLDTPQRALANNPWMASPYLPAAQYLFAGLAWFNPASPRLFQLTMVLLDIMIGVLLVKLLQLVNLPTYRVLLYLWNPLVVVEVAHGAHIDTWMVFLILGSLWFTFSPNASLFYSYLAPVLLALATLTKGLPALLLAVLFWL